MRRVLLVMLGAALCGAIAASLLAQAPAAPPGAAAIAMAAAERFLTSLDAGQLARASYPFDDKIKAGWHNLPPNMATRAGVRFADLTPAQREAGDAVLRTVLSAYGLQKVESILAADQYLGEFMGAGFATGPQAYMLAIFGKPSATDPWSIQFNGHHLGVNVTIVGRDRVLAPTLTAAYPNIYTKDGKEVIVLADEANRALKLIQSLDQTQRGKAILANQIWDFILGPGHDGQVIQPEGIRGSEMNAVQGNMLLDVAAAWVNIIDEGTAREKLADIRRNLADTYFLWSGDTTVPGKAYFRVQGPTILIEYAPQTVGGPGSVGGRGRRGGGAPPDGRGAGQGRAAGGVVVNDPDRQLDPVHVHTVYRDFTNDYGKKFIAATRR